MKRIALIPAYEPGDALIELIKKLKEYDMDVVVVNDGSGDAYKDVFERAKEDAVVISYEPNRGKGHALKEGLSYIKDNYNDALIVTMDSDGQHLPEDGVRLCDVLSEHRDRLIVGSRKLPKSAPLKSRFGNSITRDVYHVITGIHVYDTQSGLRAFSCELIPDLLKIPGEKYEYEMNVLLYFAKQHIEIMEVPIKTIYFDKENKVSHFRAIHDSARIYGEILKYMAASFLSFLLDYGLYSLIIFNLGQREIWLLAANYGARALSSLVNFGLNKKFVFKSHGNGLKEAFCYFSLVFVNITVNSYLLTVITKLGLNVYAGKLIVEIIMFSLNFLVQHFLIFKKKKEEKRECETDISLQ